MVATLDIGQYLYIVYINVVFGDMINYDKNQTKIINVFIGKTAISFHKISNCFNIFPYIKLNRAKSVLQIPCACKIKLRNPGVVVRDADYASHHKAELETLAMLQSHHCIMLNKKFHPPPHPPHTNF